MAEDISGGTPEEDGANFEDLKEDVGEIKDTDIVFDCSHCGKSLAIDYRGAGLTIPCTDCGSMVEVPIPDGLQLSDIDSSEEQRESMILGLRRSLVAANRRIHQLVNELDETAERRENLEKQRSDNIYQTGRIIEKISVARKTLDDLAQALESLADIARSIR